MDSPQTADRAFGLRTDGKLVISFFSAPASRVAEALMEWGREVQRKIVSHFPLRERWHEFLGEYSTPNNRQLVVPTQSEWCAFVDNDRIGGMPYSELLVIPERLGVRSASFVLDDLGRCKVENRPYSAMFNYCDGSHGAVAQRYVGLIWDAGRWQFHETGAPQPFEEVDAYESRRKSERLTREMLVRYARALGIYLDEGDSFFKLAESIGLKWEWLQGGDVEDDAATLTRVAKEINRELGVKWKLNVFHR